MRTYLRMAAMLCLFAVGINAVVSAATITEWNFTTIGAQSAPYNNPPPTIGSGMATSLGMSNSYNGGNTPYCDVNNSKSTVSGDADHPTSLYVWRVRGNPNNGWSIWNNGTGAPQYSQGIELDASTVGFSDVAFKVNGWYCTTQGIRDMQFQYNLNVSNSAGWTNYGGTSPTGTYVAVSNDYYGEPAGITPIVVNLSLIPGANNNPNFGIRLVSAFDSTGNVVNDYASAALTSGHTVRYNNTSGNWGFNLLSFSGSAGLGQLTPGATPNNIYWTSTGGTWDTSTTNWNSTSPPSGDNLTYADSNSVTFPDFNSSGTATISTPNGVSPAAIIISNSTGTYNFEGPGLIGGGGTTGLIKQNGGVAILSASNSYTGGTSITGGTLVVNGGDNRLGSYSGTINLDNNATLQVSGANLVSARNLFVYGGGGTIDTNSWNASTSGIVAVGGILTKTGSGDLTFSGNNVVFSGTNAKLVINSPGTVTFAGSGLTSFAGGAELDGNLVVTGLPQLNFENFATSGSGEIQIKSAGVVTGTNASTANKWVLLSNSQTNAGLVSSAGTVTNNIHLNSDGAPFVKCNVSGTSSFSLQTSHNFIVGFGGNPSGSVFAITGSIYGNSDVVLGSNTQNGGLGISGGTLLVAGQNTYTGTTIMAGNGVVQLGSSAALPSTTDVVFNATATGSSTKLDLNGNSPTINSLSSVTNGPGISITNNGGSPATLTISGATTPTTKAFGGTISDGSPSSTIAIVKQGIGTLALAGSNTYSGGTTIGGGTLLVSGTGATGTGLVNVGASGLLATSSGAVTLNSPIQVNSNGALLGGGYNTGGGTLSVEGLTLNNSSVVNFDYNPNPSLRSFLISGTGGLTFGGGANSVGINFYADPGTVTPGIVPLFAWSNSASSNFDSLASQLYLSSFNGSLPSNTGSGDFSFKYDNDPVVNALRGSAGIANQIDLFNNKLPFPAYLTWNTSSGSWNTTSANAVWSNTSGGTRTYFQPNDVTTFGDRGANPITVTVDPSGVSPSAVYFTNNTTAYTLTGGTIGGYSTVYKTGSGVVTLASPNSYIDGTQITGGTLVAAAGDASLGASSGTVQLDNGATLQAGAAGLTSSRTFQVGSGGTGVGGTVDTGNATWTLNGNVNVSGTLSKAGSGLLTLAHTKLNNGTNAVLNVASGTVQMINSVNFNDGSLAIQTGATASFDNSNGSLSSVSMANGGTFNGNLVIPATMTMNFDSGNFTGTGAIQIQSRSSQMVLTGAGTANVSANIQLNSAPHPAFIKTDVSQANPVLGGPNSAIVTIGGGNSSSFVISGVISGDSDVNITTDGLLGGTRGSVEFDGHNTYTGVTMINWNGNTTSTSGHVNLGIDDALPTSTDVIFGTLVKATTSVLNLNGHNQQIGSLSFGKYGYPDCAVQNDGPYLSVSTLTVSGSVTPYYAFGGILNNGINGGILALVKDGPNTLTISGTNNGYTGDTTLRGGGLVFSPAGGQGNASHYSIISPNVYVTGGTLSGDAYLGTYPSAGQSYSANLKVSAGGTVNPGLPVSGGSLAVYGNGSFDADSNVGFQAGVANPTVLGIGGALSLPTKGAVNVNLTNPGSFTGSMPLFTFGSLATGSTDSLAIGSAPTAYTYGFTSTSSEIDLTITYKGPQTLVWRGNHGNAWDVNVTHNFDAAQTYANGDHVTFDDTGIGSTVAILAGGLAPSSVVFSNSSESYTLTGGPITGSASLVLSGGGSLVLDNTNTYTGGTIVTSGILTVGNASALRDGTALTIGANASTIFGTSVAGGMTSAASPAAVPEPGTLALLAAGFALIAVRAIRRRKN